MKFWQKLFCLPDIEPALKANEDGRKRLDCAIETLNERPTPNGVFEAIAKDKDGPDRKP